MAEVKVNGKKLTKRSLFWTWAPRSEKEAGDSIVRNLLLHWFPAKVTLKSLSWGYSLWLGTITATLFLILTLTGVILMFLYVPSVERAYQSVKDIEYVVSFGWFIRAMHRNSAHLMVAFVFLHMVRVFLTGAYKNGIGVGQNRPLNWIVGVILLLITLFLSFTGYLLPWDQLAFWAITVGTNIAKNAPIVGEWIRFVLLGGHEIEQNALIRFYVLHCFFLPAAVLMLFSYHMWRIRKDGGLACVDNLVLNQKKEKVKDGIKSKTYSLLGLTAGRTVQVETSLIDEEKYTVNSVPFLIRRIGLVMLGTFVFVVLISLFIHAPLEEPANPNVTPNPAKAPWYFLWLQELVAITTIRIGSFVLNGALVGGILIPGILVILLAIWPYLDKSSNLSTGVWFSKERMRQNIVFLVLCFLVIVLIIIGTYMRGPNWEFYFPWEPWPQLPKKF
ncbi:cytochrome b [Candidatus Kryptonium thompsonii]|uniref:cytochrome b n=1 Tax=Candidatus Kryptonium thompsonii TaxID=1633631 RepID=UPI000707F6EC|nr:cytochrome b N-terminal domain-containing protein [Candidatus Kryptonium thompsoni]CUS78125.1 Cytochrome b subunit of the bc complex [Candidatus Kryptonium thompsoni]